jgi:hypothetical protein
MFAVFPAPYVAAAAGVTSLAFHDDAYSATHEITVPTLQAGDMMVVSDYAFNASGRPALVTPSGFTNWVDLEDVSGFGRLAVSYKIAVGDETTLTCMNGTFFDTKILAIFRPDVPISTIMASTATSEATNGNPSAQNIVATSGTLPLVAIGVYLNGGLSSVDPRTMSPAATAELNSGATTAHYMKYQLQNVSLADVSIDMDDEGGDNMLAGGYLWAA